MQQERLWILIARKLSSEASAEELLELNEELMGNEEVAYLLKVLLDFWEHPVLSNLQADAIKVESVWEKIKPV